MNKLPINENPYIRPFAENIFIDTIMNNEMTVGKCVAKVQIDQMSQFEWSYMFHHSIIQMNAETIIVEHDSFDSFSAIYRELSEEDVFVCKIEYQQYTNRWDSIVIGIDHRKEHFREYPNMMFTYGNYCSNDLFSLQNGNYHRYSRNDIEFPIWLKVVKEKQDITCFCSLDGIEWTIMFKYENVVFQDNCFIGILFCLNDNQYDKWLTNNFIQLRYNRTAGKALEYITFLKRDWRGYTVNPVVKMTHDDIKLVKEYGLSIWEYIKANINNRIYLEFWLDEFYVEGLESYQTRHHSHESLVYGYDEESKTIFMMSMLVGRPILVQIGLENFLIAQEKAYNNMIIYKFEYNPTDAPYELSIFHICEMLQDYLSGTNSSCRLEYMLPSEQGVYGIQIYDEILNYEQDQQTFLSDYRITYLWSEHKKCMCRRVEYLAARGYLKDVDYMELIQELKKIAKTADKVLNLVIKNQLAPTKKRQERIWAMLNDMKCGEGKNYPIILNSLSKERDAL